MDLVGDINQLKVTVFIRSILIGSNYDLSTASQSHCGIEHIESTPNL